MRLDKYISQSCHVSRSQAKVLIKQKRIKVDENIALDIAYQVTSESQVSFDNQPLVLKQHQYFLLHKPAGYICSTKDEVYPSALNLIGELSNINTRNKQNKFHFAGRLDADTTGLVLISNDGQWTHRVTSPRKACSKTYQVTTTNDISEKQITQLMKGVLLKGEKNKTLPATVSKKADNVILLTIYEGRYHQIKRMLVAVGNHVEKLHRLEVGNLRLADLKESKYRELTHKEVEQF